MSIKTKIRNLIESYFNKKGYEIILSRQIYEWQREGFIEPSFKKSILPEGAEEYLNPSSSRLRELQENYSEVNPNSHILWNETHVKKDDILYFRGDNAYVWQLRGSNMNIMGYALTTYYLKSIDKFNLFEKLDEDDYFGNYTFEIGGKKVSRDLLDSINEIYFLEKHLSLSTKNSFNILDIGAGYGRLAHRMVKFSDNLENYFCTDGIAVSSFIAEYYLNFRKVDHKAKIVTQNKVDETLSNHKIDLALNIHSFSECSIEEVDWWISLLKKNKVKYVMIIPNVYVNTNELLVSHDRKSILEILNKYGYELLVKEPKFTDPIVQKYGINPTYFFVFELK